MKLRCGLLFFSLKDGMNEGSVCMVMIMIIMELS